KRITVGVTITPKYHGWWSKRINDNIPRPIEECGRSINEHLRVVPSELEIIKQDFEKRSSEFGKKVEQLEEKKICLGLDVDIHKMEAEKLKKGKNNAEEDLDSLKIDCKKLRLSMRITSVGKTSEQWQQETRKKKPKLISVKRNFKMPELKRAF
ncbi:hypothetical protein Goshw_006491, partial [Gossypium schwendimanii]|nr:hypothetical protein [Gossypium schwendimanii]